MFGLIPYLLFMIDLKVGERNLQKSYMDRGLVVKRL